jgi:phosphopantothenoylcysteine decarboxylase/phosphopantothenate--cysteine ligase
MDEEMWLQPAVQENLRTLKERGALVIEPIAGPLASGLTGQGRMREPNELVDQFDELVMPRGPLSGKRVLITGGPTYEPIDAVRFIGNRSSGKMAAALAEEAAKRGAAVTLVMGPSSVETSRLISRRDIETASEMYAAVTDATPSADVVIMNAAVADFRPASISDSKLKKREMTSLAIELKPTIDILSEIASRKTASQFLVGFALEKGEGSRDYARKKLIEKRLDMIVLNDLADAGAGFSHDTNKVTIYLAGGAEIETPLLSKSECAARILDEIERSLNPSQLK